MKSEEAYSILDIVSESEGQGVVLTRSGSICVSFELREPECYSLTPEDIDRRDGMFREAFKFLPEDTYVHKQDVFLKEKYCPDIAGGSFLDRADARHFRGRLYVSHTCVMHFVLSGLKSLEKAYISSPLSYKENLHKEDLARLDEFLEGVDNAVGIIQSMRDTETAPMSGQEMRDFTAGYTTLFDALGAVVDIHADTELRTGKKRARCFAICDETFLPDGSLDSYVRDDSLPPAGSLLYHPMLEQLGMYLPYNHIVNQVVFFEGNGRLRERIARNIDIKRAVVVADERETNQRKLLNFGHSAGHAVEACEHFELGHGNCVSIGMGIITRAAALHGICDAELPDRIEELCARHGLKTRCDLDADAVFAEALHDKKRAGDTIDLVIPHDIGRCSIDRTPLSTFHDLIAEGLGQKGDVSAC